jgi:hypothetical protein
MYFLFFSLLQKLFNKWDTFCEKYRLFGHWAPRVGDRVIACHTWPESVLVKSVDLKNQTAETTDGKIHDYRHCMSPIDN